jgi:hypothetical protein
MPASAEVVEFDEPFGLQVGRKIEAAAVQE